MTTVAIPTIAFSDTTGGPVATGMIPFDSVPTVSTTLLANQTIMSGSMAVLFGKFTIPSGKTLTIESGGYLAITNIIFTR